MEIITCGWAWGLQRTCYQSHRARPQAAGCVGPHTRLLAPTSLSPALTGDSLMSLMCPRGAYRAGQTSGKLEVNEAQMTKEGLKVEIALLF